MYTNAKCMQPIKLSEIGTSTSDEDLNIWYRDICIHIYIYMYTYIYIYIYANIYIGMFINNTVVGMQ